MNVTINDEVRNIPEGASLQTLIAELGLAEKPGLAVAVNAGVVPSARWSEQMLADGDAVLLIQATQGG